MLRNLYQVRFLGLRTKNCIRYFSNFNSGFDNGFEMGNNNKRAKEESSEEEHSEKEDFKKQKESNDIAFAKNDDGEYYMDLPNSKKRLSVRTFKGNTYIDIREFYTDKNGNLAPGKKGISLKVDEYKAIKKHLDDIDKCIDDVEK